jgi:hypothetical protein
VKYKSYNLFFCGFNAALCIVGMIEVQPALVFATAIGSACCWFSARMAQ